MKRTDRRRQTRHGFTLLELLLVVAILVMLAAFAVPQVLGTRDSTFIKNAKVQISAFEDQLELYQLENATYPTSEEGLEALVTRPESAGDDWVQHFKKIPPDPWGNEYQYAFPGENNGELGPDIWSMGKDGEDGTDDDIGNWETDGDGSFEGERV